MLSVESSLVGIVRFLQVLLDAGVDLCPVCDTKVSMSDGYDRALCPVLPILSGSGNVPGIIPKLNILISFFRRNVLKTCPPDLLHILSPGRGVYNPMLSVESSLVGIVRFLQVLLDAGVDLCPVCDTKKVSMSDGKRPGSLSRYNHALCPVFRILSDSGNVPGIIPKLNILIPLFRLNGLGTCPPDLLHI
ncbi:hypothetical protein Tco_1268908, partial [Tanacetum coccineum]